MRGVDQPAGKREAIERRVLGQGRQDGRHARGHFFAAIAVIAAAEDGGFAGLGVHLGHDHGGRNGFVELFFARLELLDVGVQAAHFRVGGVGKEILADAVFLIFRAPARRDLHSGADRLPEGELLDFGRVHSTGVEAQIVDLTLERLADLDGAVVADTARRLIAHDFERRRLAID